MACFERKKHTQTHLHYSALVLFNASACALIMLITGPSGPMGERGQDNNTDAQPHAVGLYIIIDPLSDGLYRTRLYAGGSHSSSSGKDSNAGLSSMGKSAYAFGTNCSLLG